MPGFNQQGPDGNGPMTGRQQGMCRRSEELPLRGQGDVQQGRGMGRRCRGSFPQGSGGRFGANNNGGGFGANRNGGGRFSQGRGRGMR